MRLTRCALASPGSGSSLNRSRSMAGPLVGTLAILALGLMTQGLLVSAAMAQTMAVISAEGDSVDAIMDLDKPDSPT